MSFLVVDLAVEPVTLLEVKEYSKIETDSEDTYLTALITGCRREIETFCKIALGPSVFADEYDSWPMDVGGKPLAIWSPRLPVASVAISLIADDGTPTPIPQRIGLIKDMGRVRPVDNVAGNSYGPNGMRVLWSVGFGPDTEVLPAQLKDALLSLIDYRWATRGFANSAEAGIPADLLWRLNPYRAVNV